MKNSIINYLLGHSERAPHAKAFVLLDDGENISREISYGELVERVRARASQLCDQQLTGKRVILIYPDVLEFIISFLACQYAGLVPVPVPYMNGSKQFARLMSIIGDAQADAVLCAGNSKADLQKGLSTIAGEEKLRWVTTDRESPGEILPGLLKPTLVDTALIQYTSGSTAMPKGVVISAANLVHNQQLMAETFRCNATSIIFSWLPFHHDMGLIGNILHTIYIGCTCVLMSPFHFMQRPQRWLEAITKYKVTHSGGPNFAFDLCLNRINRDDLHKLDLSSWQAAYNGSEPVRAETLQQFGEYFAPAGFNKTAFVPCYGLAEATLLVSGYKQRPGPLVVQGHTHHGKILLADSNDTFARKLVSSGMPAPGMEISIVTANKNEKAGELCEGEICISGASVTHGYWNKDNGEFFVDIDGKRFLRTGDLGFMYKGELFVHGRLKEMLIIRGKNFYPYDIELAVAGIDNAIENNGVAAFGFQDKQEELVIVAEMKRTFIKESNTKHIIHAIDKAVTGLFGITPFDIILATPLNIPRTTSGKLQRVLCRDKYVEQSFTIIESKRRLAEKTPRKEVSERLVLDVLRTGSHNNIKEYLLHTIQSKTDDLPVHWQDGKTALTDVGLDSLRIVELINTVNKDLRIDIDVSKLYDDNTLSGLANTIENLLWLKTEHLPGKEIVI